MTVAKESWKGLATEQTLAELTTEFTTTSAGLATTAGLSEINDTLLGTDGGTTGYAKVQLIDSTGAFVSPSSAPQLVSASITRPADASDYAANDVISTYTVDVKQKETITLGGTVRQKQKETLTITGSEARKKKVTIALQGTIQEAQVEKILLDGIAAVKQKETMTITGTAAVAQVDVVTLTGTLPVAQVETVTITGNTGACSITIDASVNAVTWDGTSIATSVEIFAHDAGNLAEYLAKGIVLTHSGDTLIFTANVAGTGFTAPVIANISGTLNGSITSSTANVVAGTANMTIVGGTNKLITFNTDLDTTASDFVATHSNYYDTTFGITITAGTASVIFTANVAGTALPVTDVSTLTGNLAGSMANNTPNTPNGTANVILAGGLTKLLTYSTTAAAAVTAFVSVDNIADYLAVGIDLTGSGDDVIFEAHVAGAAFTAPVLDAELTGTVNGSVVPTTANVADGTAEVSVTGGLTKLVTFHTNAAAAATAFASVGNIADYLAQGIDLTADGDNIVFTAHVAGTAFDAPTFGAALTGTITGTPDHTNANAPIGTAQVALTPNLLHVLTFNTNLTTTASDFVTANSDDYLAEGVILTSGVDSLIFEANVAGVDFNTPTIANSTGGLDDASTTVDQANVTTTGVGTATVSAGTLSYTMTFATDEDATTLAFKNAHAAAWLSTDGIVLTNSGHTLIFEANVAGVGFTAVAIDNLTGDLDGTINIDQVNVAIGAATITGTGGLSKTITYVTDDDTTASTFKNANAADYLAQGIVLTNSTNTIVFEAQTAGVPFVAPVFTITTANITGSVAHTLANATIIPITLVDMAETVGGSGFLENVWIETSCVQFAGKKLVCWLFTESPAAMVGDNIVFADTITNADIRTANGGFEVTFNALPSGSARVIGSVKPGVSYTTTTTKNLYMVATAGESVVAPLTGSTFKFYLQTTQRS
jgi:hypothetical protein